MELSYETQGTSTYLVYTVPQDVQLDMVSIGMLVYNRIPGLAQTIFTQMDYTRYLKYNISTKIPADQFFMRSINRQRFLGVINGIINAMLSAEEYMLDPGTILLDLSRMYLDVRTGDTVLICVPSEECEGRTVNLKDFIKRIIYDTSFDQTENCDYVTKIINYLNSSAGLTLDDFQEFIRSLTVERSQPQQLPQQFQQPAPQFQQAPQQFQQPHPRPPVQVVDRPVPSFEAPPRQQFASPPVPKNANRQIESPSGPAALEIDAVDTPNGEKPISLMYLLRHYSKENAEAYKAQKGNKGVRPASMRPPKGGEMPVPAGLMIPGTESGRQEMGTMPPEVPVQRPPASVPVSAGAAARPGPSSFTPTPLPPPVAQAASPAQSFGDTDYFSDSEGPEETMILGMDQDRPQAVEPFLIRRKNNERIPVDKPIFRLGRSADFNDYTIIDNKYVGHSHCHLVQQGGEYFIQDDNSKNHTMVNGKMIPPGQPVKIAHGYTISVANEEFEFKLF